MYHYAGNNPVTYIDPDGRDAFHAELRQGNFKERSWFSKNIDEPVEKFIARNVFGFSPSDSLQLMDGTIVPMSESGEQFAYSERVADGMFFCVSAFAGVFKLAKASNVISLSSNSVKTAERNSVFWTGIGDDGTKAANWAKANGGTTLEMTDAVKDIPEWSPQTASKWDAVSRNFAKNAKGDVTVLVGQNGIKDGSTFSRVEFQELLNNENITSINFIYLDQ